MKANPKRDENENKFNQAREKQRDREDAYINEARVKLDSSFSIQNINDGFTNPRESFDRLLDGAGTSRAGHSSDGEERRRLIRRQPILR